MHFPVQHVQYYVEEDDGAEGEPEEAEGDEGDAAGSEVEEEEPGGATAEDVAEEEAPAAALALPDDIHLKVSVGLEGCWLCVAKKSLVARTQLSAD